MQKKNATTSLFTQRLAADPERIAAEIHDALAGHGAGDLQWICTSARPPYRVVGMRGSRESVILKWMPGKWLTLQVARYEGARFLVRALSERLLAQPPHLISVDVLTADRIYEWRLDGAVSYGRDLPANPLGSQWGYATP